MTWITRLLVAGASAFLLLFAMPAGAQAREKPEVPIVSQDAGWSYYEPYGTTSGEWRFWGEARAISPLQQGTLLRMRCLTYYRTGGPLPTTWQVYLSPKATDPLLWEGETRQATATNPLKRLARGNCRLQVRLPGGYWFQDSVGVIDPKTGKVVWVSERGP